MVFTSTLSKIKLEKMGLGRVGAAAQAFTAQEKANSGNSWGYTNQ